MRLFRKAFETAWSHWYVRTGLLSAGLGFLVLLIVIALGLGSHLAYANPSIGYLAKSGESERLLWTYDALAATNIILTLFPFLVLYPGLVIGLLAFSAYVKDGELVRKTFFDSEQDPTRLSRLEKTIYTFVAGLILVAGLLIFLFVQGPFRGLMIYLGVPR